jgi:hypothetical protein
MDIDCEYPTETNQNDTDLIADHRPRELPPSMMNTCPPQDLVGFEKKRKRDVVSKDVCRWDTHTQTGYVTDGIESYVLVVEKSTSELCSYTTWAFLVPERKLSSEYCRRFLEETAVNSIDDMKEWGKFVDEYLIDYAISNDIVQIGPKTRISRIYFVCIPIN